MLNEYKQLTLKQESHNPKVVGSNPAPATKKKRESGS